MCTAIFWQTKTKIHLKNLIMIIKQDEPSGINNLLELRDASLTQELLEKIKKNEKVSISIHQPHSGMGRKMVWEQSCLLVFDVCKAGDPRYNAISIIRDLLKKHDADGHWTRKKVEAFVHIM
jgi:hypothetical protein